MILCVSSPAWNILLNKRTSLHLLNKTKIADTQHLKFSILRKPLGCFIFAPLNSSKGKRLKEKCTQDKEVQEEDNKALVFETLKGKYKTRAN